MSITDDEINDRAERKTIGSSQKSGFIIGARWAIACKTNEIELLKHRLETAENWISELKTICEESIEEFNIPKLNEFITNKIN